MALLASSQLISDDEWNSAEAGTGPGCNYKGGASATLDPNAPNVVNTDTLSAAQPVV